MTPSNPSLVQAAARNNAEWCASMSRTHGVEGEFEAGAWAAPARTPVFYPDAVTLAPNVDASTLLARIDTSAGASVKDSFADLDPQPHGFEILFEAQWIHRPAGAPSVPAELAWTAVGDPDALRAWALAWDGGDGNADLFRPDLLADPDIRVIAGLSPDGRMAAGAVVNRSENVVGISNVFAAQGGPDAAWPMVLEAVHTLFPSLPVVGYEQGDDLAAAARHGFEPVGPLRVWLRA